MSNEEVGRGTTVGGGGGRGAGAFSPSICARAHEEFENTPGRGAKFLMI